LENQLADEQKRTKSLISEKDRFRQLRDEAEHQMSMMQEKLDACKVTKKELHYYREQYDILSLAKSQLTTQNKEIEYQLNEAQQKLVQNSNQAIDRWDSLQDMYAQVTVLKTELESKLAKVTQEKAEMKDELTSQLKTKELEISKLYQTNKIQTEQQIHSFDNEASVLKRKHQIEFDQLKKQIEKDTQKYQKQIADLTNITKAQSEKFKELKDILKLSSEQLDKKE